MTQQYSLVQLAHSETVQNNFAKILGKRAPQFLSSVLSVANGNNSFKNADPNSVLAAAKIAATLDLPVNPNLGYMYIIPYGRTANAQIGYKGYIQLAQRSGLYKHLNAIPVYEDEFKSYNPLTEELEYEPHFKNRGKNEKPVGYVGHFELLNGFSKTVYWTREQIDEHRRKFSKMSGGATPEGVWADNFDAMALKTVLRNLLSKWGPLSTEMQTAYEADEEMIEPNEPKTVEAEETETNTVDSLLEDTPTENQSKEAQADENKQTTIFDEANGR